MNQLTITLAQKINVAHQHAISHADKAIEYARQAGELLLSVKNDLPHGDFIPWVECNVDVTPRQAQRYMAAAQGKVTPVRRLASKATHVSYLPNDSTVRPFIQNLKIALKKLEGDFQKIYADHGGIHNAPKDDATMLKVQNMLLSIENALHHALAKNRKQGVTHG